jgi:hypothetical protein
MAPQTLNLGLAVPVKVSPKKVTFTAADATVVDFEQVIAA